MCNCAAYRLVSFILALKQSVAYSTKTPGLINYCNLQLPREIMHFSNHSYNLKRCLMFTRGYAKIY